MPRSPSCPPRPRRADTADGRVHFTGAGGAAARPRRGGGGRLRPPPRGAERGAIPSAAFRSSPGSGSPQKDGKLWVGDSYLEVEEGPLGDPEHSLLNHIALRVDSASRPHRRGARARARDRRHRRRAQHLRALHLGAGARKARVRRAQGELFPRLTSIIAGAGMAGTRAPPRTRPSRAHPYWCSRRVTAPAARCCFRAASSGGTASSSAFARNARTGDEAAPAQRSTSASTTTSSGSSRWARPIVGPDTGNPDTCGLSFRHAPG